MLRRLHIPILSQLHCFQHPWMVLLQTHQFQVISLNRLRLFNPLPNHNLQLFVYGWLLRHLLIQPVHPLLQKILFVAFILRLQMSSTLTWAKTILVEKCFITYVCDVAGSRAHIQMFHLKSETTLYRTSSHTCNSSRLYVMPATNVTNGSTISINTKLRVDIALLQQPYPMQTRQLWGVKVNVSLLLMLSTAHLPLLCFPQPQDENRDFARIWVLIPYQS